MGFLAFVLFLESFLRGWGEGPLDLVFLVAGLLIAGFLALRLVWSMA